jgi:hypothetical protein
MTDTIEYRTIDKSSWPSRGAWDAEPDKKQWRDAATGLPCLAVRHPSSGHWCGYVGVSKAHPAHGANYDTTHYADEDGPDTRTPAHLALNDVAVHGGLTFASACRHGDDPSRGVCHIPAAGEPDDVWWFGFDCAHCDDLSPGQKLYGDFPSDDVYRDLAYVEGQCADLARQLAAIQSAA